MREQIQRWMIGPIGLVIGLVLVVKGIGDGKDILSFYRTTEPTSATVIGVEKRKAIGGSRGRIQTNDHPMYEFLIEGEATRRSATSPVGYKLGAFAKGDALTIYYDPAKPYLTRIDDFKSRWLHKQWVLGLIGGVILFGFSIRGTLRMLKS